MPNKKWSEAIVEAFEALGGEAHYSDLYDYIKNHPPRSLTKAWQATVRREIENSSTDSENYVKGRPDLFYSVGLGSGTWGLRSMRQSGATKDVSSKNSKILKEISGTSSQNIDPIVAIDLKEPVAPERMQIQVTRVIRDTAIVRRLKQLYLNKCQVCGEAIVLRSKHYSEGHHLQPLGSDHKGPDIEGNIIVVCPNHHAEFDYGAIAINPDTLELVHVNQANRFSGDKLQVHSLHPLGKQYLTYHYDIVFMRKSF
jgi:hypothetical protein